MPTAPREQADAIFVFAGRESRKRYAVELFERGIARELILSVGRYEWRKFELLPLPGDGGLVDGVQATEPKKRHFFVRLKDGQMTCERVPIGRLGTWSEARAVARLVLCGSVERLVVVSHREHLPRCLLALRSLLPTSCALVPMEAPLNDEPPLNRAAEVVKFLGYTALCGLSRGRGGRACAEPGFLL